MPIKQGLQMSGACIKLAVLLYFYNHSLYHHFRANMRLQLGILVICAFCIVRLAAKRQYYYKNYVSDFLRSLHNLTHDSYKLVSGALLDRRLSLVSGQKYGISSDRIG